MKAIDVLFEIVKELSPHSVSMRPDHGSVDVSKRRTSSITRSLIIYKGQVFVYNFPGYGLYSGGIDFGDPQLPEKLKPLL